jgi:hypothetical protein
VDSNVLAADSIYTPPDMLFENKLIPSHQINVIQPIKKPKYTPPINKGKVIGVSKAVTISKTAKSPDVVALPLDISSIKISNKKPTTPQPVEIAIAFLPNSLDLTSTQKKYLEN